MLRSHPRRASDIADSVLLAAKVVQRAHVTTFHGGSRPHNGKCKREILDTRPSKIDEESHEKLQQLQTFSSCSFHKSSTSTSTRKNDGRKHALQCDWCVDFLGPVKYHNKCKEERKVYVVLYSCSLTRGVFLELLTSLETGEFLKSLKHFIAQRGRPSRIYSDNGQKFVATAKWLKKAHSDKELKAFLNNHSMPCRVPWCGVSLNV